MSEDDSTAGDLGTHVRELHRGLTNAIEPILGERPTMEHVLLLLFLGAGTYMYLGALEFSSAAGEFPRLMAGATAILAFLILVRNYLDTVVPVLAIVLGVYSVYTGATEFLEEGTGLLRTAIGIGLIVAVVGYRDQLVGVATSFIAEPMQVLGEDDLVADGTSESEADDDDTTDASEESADDGSGSGAMYVYDIDNARGPVVTALLCLGYTALAFAIGMLYATPLFVAAWALWARMDVAKGAALTGLSLLCSYLFYDLIQSDISEGWLTGWAPTPPDDLFAEHVEPLVPFVIGPGEVPLDVGIFLDGGFLLDAGGLILRLGDLVLSLLPVLEVAK